MYRLLIVSLFCLSLATAWTQCQPGILCPPTPTKPVEPTKTPTSTATSLPTSTYTPEPTSTPYEPEPLTPTPTSDPTPTETVSFPTHTPTGEFEPTRTSVGKTEVPPQKETLAVLPETGGEIGMLYIYVIGCVAAILFVMAVKVMRRTIE